MEKAGMFARIVAYVIDYIVVGIVLGLASVIGGMVGGSDNGPIIAGILTLIVAFGYYPYFWSSSGQTPGKKVMGIKVVKKDGSLVSMGGGFIRFIGYLVDFIVIGIPIGVFWAFIDADQQCWHDKIAGTIVIKV